MHSFGRYKGHPVILAREIAAAIVINLGVMAVALAACVAVPCVCYWTVAAMARNMGIIG